MKNKFYDEIYNMYGHKMKDNHIIIISMKNFMKIVKKLHIKSIDDIPENIMYDYYLDDEDIILQNFIGG